MLGVDIEHVVVQDHDGNVYWAESIASEQAAPLAATTRSAAMTQLRTILSDNAPEFPAGSALDTRNWRGNSLDSMPSENLMETHLSAIVSPTAKGWGDGVYYAFTRAGVEISLGLEGARESDSFHVVRGTW